MNESANGAPSLPTRPYHTDRIEAIGILILRGTLKNIMRVLWEVNEVRRAFSLKKYVLVRAVPFFQKPVDHEAHSDAIQLAIQELRGNKGFELIKIQSFSHENIVLTPLRHFYHKEYFQNKAEIERSRRICGC